MTDPTPQTPTRDEAVPTGWKLVPVDPTEEMIEAMREAARKVSRGGISGMTIDAQFRAEHRPEYASYAAMLASAPAPASGGVNAVAVKALEWRSHAWGAEADGGRYRIEDNGTNWTDDRYWLFVNVGLLSNHRSKFATLDEAKAAAQADYEQRIHSALSPAATPVSEAGAIEFVQPGAKKAGDRISLPGGWYYERANDDGVVFVPRRPDGRGFGFEGNGKGLALTVVQDFAKAMWSALSPAAVECEECSGIGHTGIDGDVVYDCPACLGEGHLTPLREAQYKLECLAAEFDQAVGTIEARNAELSDISAAIASTRFMDPPDGGAPSLATQVRRMREALENAEAALATPASSPAGGDVEDRHAIKALMKAIQRAEDGAGTIPAKEAVKLRPADWHAVCDRARKLAALSQSAGRGE